MLLKLSTYLTHYFIKKNIIKSNLSQIYIYGFQLTISTLCSLLSILLLSSFSNFIFGITFLLFFMPLRFCAGGYHSNTYQKCFILTNLCFLFTLFSSKIFYKYHLFNLNLSLFFISVILLWIYAPCENINNPLSNTYLEKNRLYTHILLIIYIFTLSIFAYFFNTFLFFLGTHNATCVLIIHNRQNYFFQRRIYKWHYLI